MNDKVNYAVVGLFVLALGGSLIGFALWLGFAGESRHYTHYVTYFQESVSGLDVKATVKYRGVDVGRVKSIKLDHDDPSRVRVELEIEAGTPIKTDTLAILSSQGLTGIAHIELSGSSSGEDLPGGSLDEPTEIASGPSLFVRLDSAVSTLLDQMRDAASYLSKVAERINEVMATDNMQAANDTLMNVRNLTQSLAAHADTLSDAVKNVDLITAEAARISAQASAMTAELPQLTVQVRETLSAFDQTAKAIDKTANAISDTAGTLTSLAVDTRSDLRDAARDTMPEVTALLQEVRQLTQTLNRLGQDLERDPSLLLRGRSNAAPGPGE